MDWNFNEIEFFPQVVIRTPTLPLDELLKDSDIFEGILSNDAFTSALYLANSAVYLAAMDWKSGKKLSQKKEIRLKKTLYNYWSRMHSNCTPFGLFALVAKANWGKKTSLTVHKQRKLVKLDMELLHHFVVLLENIPSIKNNIRYYPNNTRYVVGEKLRFNEFYFAAEKMSYRLSAVDADDFILDLLNFAIKGKTIKELVDYIDDGEYERAEIAAFVGELFREQLLFSELKLNIIGQDPFERLLETLRALKLEKLGELIDWLEQIATLLKQVEQSSDFIPLFNKLQELIVQRLPNVDPKKMIRVDTYGDFSVDTKELDPSLQQRIYEAVKVVGSFDQRLAVPFLEEFKEKFWNRYENAVVPLMEVIDTESGLSFGHFKFLNDNLFLDQLDIEQGPKKTFHQAKEDNPCKLLLYKKYFDYIKSGAEIIQLEKKDFEHISSDISKMAPSCQVIFNLIDTEKNLIALETAGNSSAANLISRFSCGDDEITQILKDIADYEQQHYGPTCIVAEIAHIPEHRIGNLTFRTTFRDYEIPIVTPSTLPDGQQVRLGDLFVTVRRNQVLLFSKKLGKYVIPKLSNAHNYSKNTLPIYMFLGELSYQGIHPSLRIDLGLLPSFGKFLPRVQYENVILSKAQWRLDLSDMEPIFGLRERLTKESVAAFTKHWKLPRYTVFAPESSNMLVDWENLQSVYFFLKSTTSNNEIRLVEFPYSPSSGVRNSEGRAFNNEIIAFFKNKANKATPYATLSIPKVPIQRNFYPGDRWLYYKIYCGQKTFSFLMENHLLPLVKQLQADQLIQQFFFLPFRDPEFHLRIRLKAGPESLQKIRIQLDACLGAIKKQGLAHKVQVDTYKRELERYGAGSMQLAESIFTIDSLFLLENHAAVFKNHRYFIPLLVVKQLDVLLDGFGRDLSFKKMFFEKIRDAYFKEFLVEGKSPLKKEIDKTMLAQRTQVEAAMSGEFPFLKAEEQTVFLARLDNYRAAIHKLYLRGRPLLDKTAFIEDFLRSIVHMHCIRSFANRPRQNELFVYHALCLYYKKQTYIQ